MWINVSGSGSIHVLAAIKKGWGGIRNKHASLQDSKGRVSIPVPQHWRALCALAWDGGAGTAAAQGPAEHHSQPDASQKAAGTSCRLWWRTSPHWRFCLFYWWHDERSFISFFCLGCQGVLSIVADKRRRWRGCISLHLTSLAVVHVTGLNGHLLCFLLS